MQALVHPVVSLRRRAQHLERPPGSASTRDDRPGSEIYAMAEGTPEHAALCAAVLVGLAPSEAERRIGTHSGHPARIAETLEEALKS